MPVNKQIVLDSRPTGAAELGNFKLVETEAPAPGPGQVLVRNVFLSLDPYMRGRMNDAKSYAKPQELGVVMGGGTVGEVVASNNERFKPGDKVVGMGGWQNYSVSNGGDLRVVDVSHIPIQAYLGPVGMPGVTAWAWSQQDYRAEKERNNRRHGRDRRGRRGGRPIGQARRR